jgi:molybdopterin molybdotransferase
MGEHDYVPKILQEIGLKLKISKLRIKPGKPFAFAHGEDGRMAFGLPGNPVSAFVCTVRLASRVLNRLTGGPPAKITTDAILTGNLPANGPRELYLPGVRTGQLVAPATPNGSADLFTLARTNCLICRAENAQPAVNGDHIIVIDI